MEFQQIIDVEKFARAQDRYVGQLEAAALSRLKGMVNPSSKPLKYEIQGALTERREPQIQCTIRGAVYLQCQRCLGDLFLEMKNSSTIIFVESEDKLPLIEDEDESVDYVILPESLDLMALIEEEIILALPLVPRHPEGECKELSAQKDQEQKASPFAVLAKLKQS